MALPDDDHIDRLYQVPLSSFIAERNELAKKLSAEGERDGAAAVKALPKPSVPAWVVNQIARRHADLLDQIIEAGKDLREAQRAAMLGSDPDAVRAATNTERAHVNEAVERARAIMQETNVAATNAQLDKVADTLYALASNDIVREQVRRGRLSKEVQRVGFGDFEISDEELALRTSAPKEDRRAAREREALQAKLERAKERAERLAAEAEDARRRADQAEQVARAAADEVAALTEEMESQGV